MQPCLHTCRIKVKCGALVCIKNSSTKVSPLCLLYNVDNKFMHTCNVIAFYVLYTKIHIPKKLQYQRKIKREKFPVMFV